MNLIFFLGKFPLLSIAEIFSVLKSKNIKYSVKMADENYLYLNLKENIYPDILLKILGGTIKIFQVEEIAKREEIKRIKNKNKVNLNDQEYALGSIVASQDIKEYAHKEMDKPYAAPKTGMMPSKLAKILLNLSIGKKTNAIYDPFCGTGAILQEAMHQGYKVYGSDISKEAVDGTIKNLEWTKKEIGEKAPEFEIFIHNGKILPDRLKLSKDNIAIATEPYLGLPWKDRIPKNVRNMKEIMKVGDIIDSSIKSMSKILKKGERLVIIVPNFKVRHKIVNLESKTSEYPNLVRISLINNLMFGDKHIDEMKSFLYYREGTVVTREIFIFEKI